jgi:hypothetical protein
VIPVPVVPGWLIVVLSIGAFGVALAIAVIPALTAARSRAALVPRAE